MSKKKKIKQEKPATLSSTDKKNLRAAYEAALNDLPQADTPGTGLTADGSTLRESFQKALDNGSIFKTVENMVNNKIATVDEFIFSLKRHGLGIPRIR